MTPEALILLPPDEGARLAGQLWERLAVLEREHTQLIEIANTDLAGE